MTSHQSKFNKYFSTIRQLLRGIMIIIPVAITIGSLVALFLWLLGQAIHFRFDHQWLLFLLPMGGLAIHLVYRSIGKSSEKGNNLIIEQIHLQGGAIPIVMTPLILLTTILTHLLGGSAGREGTAVQIGGSIAAQFGRWFKLKGPDMQMVVTAGIAAGFGAVFGTPVTGAIFALEILAPGKIQYKTLLPILIAAVAGDLTVAAWHISHTHYHIDALPATHYGFSSVQLYLLLFAKVMLSSAAFGLASLLFIRMGHEIKYLCNKIFSNKWMIPVFGGLLIIGLTILLGKPDYLSLGVDPEYAGAVTIPSAFSTGGADTWSWLWKTIYTTITLATGFKGGEVTPLFYIGATLGNTCAALLDAPVSLFAALGFIAVFAGATKTPIACTIMGIELFGRQHAVLFAAACFIAYLCSGHRGIYIALKMEDAQCISPSNPANSFPPMTSNKYRSYLGQKISRYKEPFR